MPNCKKSDFLSCPIINYFEKNKSIILLIDPKTEEILFANEAATAVYLPRKTILSGTCE